MASSQVPRSIWLGLLSGALAVKTFARLCGNSACRDNSRAEPTKRAIGAGVLLNLRHSSAYFRQAAADRRETALP